VSSGEVVVSAAIEVKKIDILWFMQIARRDLKCSICCAIINPNTIESLSKEEGMKAIKLLVILLLIAPVCVFSIISGNYTEEAYEEDGDGTSSTSAVMSSVSQIRTLIIEAAGHYLKSYSGINLFLNRVETGDLEGVDFQELTALINSAIYDMEKSRASYCDLKTVASATPYRMEVIERLKSFDYDGFLDGHNLNPTVYQEVRQFLSKGDVNGFYNQLHIKTSAIVEVLNGLRIDVIDGRVPPAQKLWDVTQSYADALLFGQYATRIFGAFK
jgi:hypothetical protein